MEMGKCIAIWVRKPERQRSKDKLFIVFDAAL
jgi:hypothetical protein